MEPSPPPQQRSGTIPLPTKKAPRSSSNGKGIGGKGGGNGGSTASSSSNNNTDGTTITTTGALTTATTTTTNTVRFNTTEPRAKKKKKDRSNSISGTTTTTTTSNSHQKKIILPTTTTQQQQQESLEEQQSQQETTTTTATSSSMQRHQKDTATADGRMMYELLNTFSMNEYQRFQSHQRCSLSSSVIENYIAACIDYQCPNSNSINNSIDAVTSSKLENYVSTPSHCSDIGIIVGVAAKIYAQRLIAEAVYLQKKDLVLQQQQQQEKKRKITEISNNNNIDNVPVTASVNNNNNGDDDGNTTNNTISNTVLLCNYVYRAVQDRQLRNVDPGFFIISGSSSMSNHIHNNSYNVSHTTSHLLYDQRRLAAATAIAATTLLTVSDMEIDEQPVEQPK